MCACPNPQQLEDALNNLVGELDAQTSLNDYRQRRSALRGWCIDPRTWRLIVSQVRAHAKDASSIDLGDRNRQTASMLAWSRVTQGELPLALYPMRHRLPANEQKSWHIGTRNTFRRLQTGHATPHERDLSVVLDRYSDTLSARIDNGNFA